MYIIIDFSVLSLYTGLGSHQSSVVAHCAITRQVKFSAICKVKLKEHGLINKNNNRTGSKGGSHRKNGNLSSRNYFSTGGIYSGADMLVTLWQPRRAGKHPPLRLKRHTVVCLKYCVSEQTLKMTFLTPKWHSLNLNKRNLIPISDLNQVW